MKNNALVSRFPKTALAAAAMLLASCRSVPMQDAESDARAKRFDPPPKGWCGLYIYRDGMAFSRSLYVDDHYIGKTGSKTYFYRLVRPGEHWVRTGDNKLQLHAIEGVNHFVHQWVRLRNIIPETVLWGSPAKTGAKAVMELGLAADADNETGVRKDDREGSRAAIPMMIVDRSTISTNGILGPVGPMPAPPVEVDDDGVRRVDEILISDHGGEAGVAGAAPVSDGDQP